MPRIALALAEREHGNRNRYDAEGASKLTWHSVARYNGRERCWTPEFGVHRCPLGRLDSADEMPTILINTRHHADMLLLRMNPTIGPGHCDEPDVVSVCRRPVCAA